MESMGFDSDYEESDFPICTEPTVLKYREEMKAYEGFYVNDCEYVRNHHIGGCFPCAPEFAHLAVTAAKWAIEHHNKEATEALTLEEVIRSNVVLSAEDLWFITFRATNGKFYETKAWVDVDELAEFIFLRPAKYYRNLCPLTSESD